MKNRTKLLICGIGFGNFYLRALLNLKEDFEIAGILSRGSKESKEYAKKYNIDLYESIEQLPVDIDIACVAIKTEVMGGEGEKIAIELMKRKINVILEQPIHYKNLLECFKVAQNNGVVFSVGDLYLYLENVRKLLLFTKPLQEEIMEIDIECSARMLFPVFHILVNILPFVQPICVEYSTRNDNVNQIILGKLGKTSFVFKINNEIEKNNPDSYMRMFFSIEVIFKQGKIVLCDAHGPLIYYPSFYLPFDKKNAIKIQNDFNNIPIENNIYVGSEEIYPYGTIFNELWPCAIKDNILDFCKIIAMRKRYLETCQKTLLCAQCWKELSKYLGDYLIVDYCRVNKQKREQISEEVSREEITSYLNVLDKISYKTMLSYLQKKMIFVNEKGENISDVLEKFRSPVRKVLSKWIYVLTQNNFLRENDGKYYCKEKIKWEDVIDEWESLERHIDRRICSEKVISYFKDNALNLDELIGGTISATYLLFPKGNMDIARSLYSETLIAQQLNNKVAEIVYKLFLQKGKKEFSILEIGAGTGATTEKILNKLPINEISYTVSDVSKFFVNNLVKEFRGVKGEIINIDKDIEGPTYDVIVAAGVLNNAKNIVFTLENLKKLLVKSGNLIVTEPIKEFPQMLISQAFMMTENEELENQLFMSKEQWLEKLENVGFEIKEVFPREESKYYNFGQCLFLGEYR